MKIVKLLLLVMLAAIGAVAWLTTRSSLPTAQIAQQPVIERERVYSRADDPTYAEEVRKLVMENEEIKRRADLRLKEMDDRLKAMQSQLGSSTDSTGKQIQNEMNNLQTMMAEQAKVYEQMIKQQEQTFQERIKAVTDSVNEKATAAAQQAAAGWNDAKQQVGHGINEISELISGDARSEGNRVVVPPKNTANPVTPTSPAGPTLGSNEGQSGAFHFPELNLGSLVSSGVSGGVSGSNAAGQTTTTPTGDISIRPYGMAPAVVASGGGFGDAISDIWKKPNAGTGSTGAGSTGGNLGIQTGSANDNPFNISVGAQAGAKTVFKPIPVYTIPDTSTLVVNSMMTPIIGRVPITGNSITDPFRFKFITGPENLATNGHRIPGVAHIVWTGWAMGVRDQSCVRGFVDTVTYTFEDGRIQTKTIGKGTGSTTSKALGYLTDQWGKPCIRGTFISNASAYLRDRTTAAFLSALAGAAASTHVTNNSTESGGVQSFVSGNTAEYVGFNALSGAMDEIVAYVRERSASAFDVVYVPPGVQVQMFVEQQIDIDYNPLGRKIAYDYSDMGDITHDLD